MSIITILTIPLMLAVTCESTKTQTRIYAQCHIARDVLCRKVEGVEKKQSANDRVNKAQDTSISKLQLHVNLLQTKNELFKKSDKEFEGKIEQLGEKNQQLEEKNQQFDKKIEQLGEKNEHFQEKNQQFDKKLEQLEEKNQQLKEINQQFDKKLEQLEEKNQRFDEKLEQLEEKNQQFNKKIEMLDKKNDNEEVKTLVNKLKDQNEQLKIDSEQFKINNEQLKNDNEQLKALVNKLQEQVASLSNYFNYSSCLQIYNEGQNSSGIYQLNPGNGFFFKLISVYCDHDSSNGGWTVIQRRFDGSIDFYKKWEEYKTGFGSLNGEFYLGNDNIYYLTKDKPHYIRFDLQDWEGNNAYAEYDNFQISSEADNYRVNVNGSSYRGTAGDSFGFHNNMQFSTYDRDNDEWLLNCAADRHGAWWFNDCDHSHLNGEYFPSSQTPEYDRGVIWHHWKGSRYSLKAVSMKIKPMN